MGCEVRWKQLVHAALLLGGSCTKGPKAPRSDPQHSAPAYLQAMHPLSCTLALCLHVPFSSANSCDHPCDPPCRATHPHVPIILYISGGGGLLERMAACNPDCISIDQSVDIVDGIKRIGTGFAVQVGVACKRVESYVLICVGIYDTYNFTIYHELWDSQACLYISAQRMVTNRVAPVSWSLAHLHSHATAALLILCCCPAPPAPLAPLACRATWTPVSCSAARRRSRSA